MTQVYKVKRLSKDSTDCVVINDNGEVFTGITWLAQAKRWAKDMNDQTKMGLYFIEKHMTAKALATKNKEL